MYRFWLLTLLLTPLFPAGAEVIVDNARSVNIVANISYLEDTEGTYTIEDVSSGKYDSQFVPARGDRLSLGTTSSIFWARFTIRNISQYSRWLLVSNKIWLKTFELYSPSDHSYKRYSISGLTPFYKRYILNRKLILPLELPYDKTMTFYVRIGANTPAFDLTLEEINNFVKDNQDTAVFDFLLFGVVLAMIIYNGILSIILRSVIYAYYVLYLTMISLYLFLNKGYGLEYLWPDAVHFNFVGNLAFMGPGTIFLALFSARFLNLFENHRKVYWLLIGFAIINLFPCVLFMIKPDMYSAMLLNLVYILGPFVFLFAGFTALYYGYKPARLFLSGYAILLFFVLVTLLDLLGIISSSFAENYGVHLGVALEAMVFSYALADRINRMKAEHSELMIQNLEKDRILLKQSQKAFMGEMIGVIAHQWKQPLSSIGMECGDISDAYQYKQLDNEYLEKFETRIQKNIDYMTRTIDDFRNFFNPNKKRKQFLACDVVEKSLHIMQYPLEQSSIEIELNVGDQKVFGLESEFLQVMLNLLNNAKDALHSKSPKDRLIKITSETVDKKTCIRICDNGGGIDESLIDRIFDPYFTTRGPSGTGIGLYMVKMVIRDSFGGKVIVENHNEGTCFGILLPSSYEDFI